MGKYSLLKGHDGQYRVVNSKRITSNNKSDHMLEGRSVTLITSCDDKNTLGEICKNLNCQSPKIKLFDTQKRNKPKVVSVKSVHTRTTILTQPKKGSDEDDTIDQSEFSCGTSELGKDKDTTFDGSGFSYEETESGSNSEADHDEETLKKNKSQKNKIINTSEHGSSLSLTDGSASSDSSSEDYSFNVPGNSACDDSNLKSTLSHDSQSAKKHLCFYCEKLQTQLARHLILKHSNEDEVKKFIFLPPKSQERGEAIAEIRKKGDFKLFTNAKLNNGIIVPSRRPASDEKAKAENFTACIKCKGIYTKNNLRHHFAQCNNNQQTVPSVLKKARITVGRIHERASTVLRQKVLPRMKEDEIYKCIRYDLLIILYGNDLCLSHRKEYMHRLIRANLRLCGRFLLHIKQLNPQINDFSSIYNPTMYHFLIGAIDSFAGVNITTGHYEKANNATEMSKHIKKIGEIYIGECIINKNPEKQKEIQDFLNLCKRGFANVTNKTAMETLVARQREKTVILPSTVDIMRLSQYLDKLITVNYEKLKQKYSYSSWRNLADATLTRIQVFNRRRAGEAERLLISDLKNVQKITEKDEGFKDLTEEERKAANEYVRIELRGKLNINVPILLTNTWHKALKLIVKNRHHAGVSKKNIFVFGIDGQENDSFLSATALMRRFSDECNAANPKSLRGTPLRKHVATKCAQFGLNKTKTAHVAKFMGHDIKIHENIYKQPVAKTDIIDMSKVLEKAQHVYDDSSANDISVNSYPSFSESGVSQDVSALTDKDINSSINTDFADNSIADTEISNSSNLRVNEKKSLKIQKVPWTTSEFKLLNQHFGVYIKSKTLPSFPDIRSVQQSKNILLNRTPTVIKTKINNTIQAKNNKNSKDDNDTAKNTNKSQIKSHIKFVFGKYIADKSLPSLSKCLRAKKNDKILSKLSAIEIQKLVQKFLS